MKSAPRFSLEELRSADLYLGVLGGGGFTWQVLDDAAHAPSQFGALAAAATAATFGAVIAAVAVITAFMDESFLRKVRAMNRSPTRYVDPFIFTAQLSVVATVLLLVLATMDGASKVALGIVAFPAGLSGSWAIASLLPDLDLLRQFVELKSAAAQVPDDPND